MNHEETVLSIAGQLKKRPAGGRVAFVRQGVSHKVPNANVKHNDAYKVTVGKMDRILIIDPERKICVAESGVTFSDLVKATLPHNLAPYTVPELKTITIGGAVAGSSVESMSFRFGNFHDSCLEYEMITGNGEIITCSREKDPEIFNMAHGTFGTIGLITKITFKLLPAKPFVHVINVKFNTFENFKSAIEQHYREKDFEFMDGIIHSNHEFVLCLGNFSDTAPFRNRYEGQKIYYKSTGKLEEDYMMTYDYFFRYDHDCHWISRNFGLENRLLRRLFGRYFLSSTKMIRTAKKLSFFFKHLKPEVVVDVFVPMSRFENFFRFYTEKFNYYPLWIVPYHLPEKYPWINPAFLEGIKDNLFLDCAIYGLRQKKGVNYYKLLDDKLQELQGIKTLISHNAYDPATFWKIYHLEQYGRIKKITDPDNTFPDLYRKTHK